VPIEIPDHPVPAGPLAVRYLSYELPPLRAATTSIAAVELENAGTGTWHAFGPAHIRLSYHWLDRFGNVLVWEGLRALPELPVEPGTRLRLALPIAAPMPPGRYRLVMDIVDEGRLWFAELGNSPLELELDVLPRLTSRTLSVRIGPGTDKAVRTTETALATQDEPVEDEGEAVAFLAAGCEPAQDWSRRILDSHEEGFAACGGSIEVTGGLLGRRSMSRQLAPWRPGFGRAPSWPRPLVCPSILAELEERAAWLKPVAGLPALDPSGLAEPWICDGRIRVAIAAPGGKPRATARRRDDRRPP
jgi:hypothetical protein